MEIAGDSNLVVALHLWFSDCDSVFTGATVTDRESRWQIPHVLTPTALRMCRSAEVPADVKDSPEASATGGCASGWPAGLQVHLEMDEF